MEVFGLEARRNDLARGIVVVRCRVKLSGDLQRELWNMLAVGGVTEAVESDAPATLAGSLQSNDDNAEPKDEPRELMAAPWMPPSTGELVAQRQALEHAAAKFEIVAAWFLKVETGIDSSAWISMNDDDDQDDDDQDDDDADDDELDDQDPDDVDDDDQDPDDDDQDPEDDDDNAEPQASTTQARATTAKPQLGRAVSVLPAPAKVRPVTAEPSTELPIATLATERAIAATGAASIAEDASEPDAGDSMRILFRAPDAPDQPPTLWSEASGDPLALDDMTGSDDDDDNDGEIEIVESRWRSGLPPLEYSVTFPLERYPEILDQYDPEDFGVAIKLSGHAVAGEDTVVNAMFALWLSAYQDERSETFEPFRRADVVHDRTHRSALLWVERLRVPATAADQVHFLMWIIARLGDITPIMWARFDSADEAEKAKASADDNRPFVLAGNPFEERLQRHGHEAALAWAVSQSIWTKRELAGMLIEVSLHRDPNDAVGAALAETLLRRALLWDELSNARGYLAIVLIRQRRFAEAYEVALGGSDDEVRLLTVIETAQVAPEALTDVPDDAPAGTPMPLLRLLNPATIAASTDENLTELVIETAKHAPALLTHILPMLPPHTSLVPHLYNASFGLERTTALKILQRIIELPPPPPGNSEARAAFAMAWNNACIHAHALGDFTTAAEIAEGGLAYGDENPYMYHSAACAFAALGNADRALELLSLAIAADYEHIEKMETDPDLAPLFKDSRFSALFKDWRDHRADLN